MNSSRSKSFSEPRGRNLTGIDIEVTDLAGPKGTIPAKANVTIYFETYINLKVPSSIEGAAGDWPDPLIPRVDRLTGETRNAFPMRLAAGRNQAVWIDVYVPLSTPPGEYDGQRANHTGRCGVCRGSAYAACLEFRVAVHFEPENVVWLQRRGRSEAAFRQVYE